MAEPDRGADRRWRARALRSLLVLLVVAGAVWCAFVVTPGATVRVGNIRAELSAALGSGSRVQIAEGRAVTDDLVGGPLRVNLHVHLGAPGSMTEPQLMAALRGSRSSLLHAALGYLLRVAGLACLIAVGATLLLLRRRPAYLALAAVVSVGAVGGSAAASAATTSLSTFTSASCAHGWSRYVVSDLAGLTPSAPTVPPVPPLLADGHPGVVVVEQISDAHLNPEGLRFALALQRASGAAAVLDGGDTTSYGLAGEACVVLPVVRQFHVPYVWVRGNHDGPAFVTAMQHTPGVVVLDHRATTVAGLRVYGVADPAFTPLSPNDPASLAHTVAAVRPTIADDLVALTQPADVLLVHDCRMAIGPGLDSAAGIVPLVLCGHTHRYAVATDRGTTVLHSGTVGAGGLGAYWHGALQPFSANLLLFDAAEPHRLLGYYVVQGAGGGAPATFSWHAVAPDGEVG